MNILDINENLLILLQITENSTYKALVFLGSGIFWAVIWYNYRQSKKNSSNIDDKTLNKNDYLEDGNDIYEDDSHQMPDFSELNEGLIEEIPIVENTIISEYGNSVDEMIEYCKKEGFGDIISKNTVKMGWLRMGRTIEDFIEDIDKAKLGKIRKQQ